MNGMEAQQARQQQVQPSNTISQINGTSTEKCLNSASDWMKDISSWNIDIERIDCPSGCDTCAGGSRNYFIGASGAGNNWYVIYIRNFGYSFGNVPLKSFSFKLTFIYFTYTQGKRSLH